MFHGVYLYVRSLSDKIRILLTALIKIIRIYESFLLNEVLAYGKING